MCLFSLSLYGCGQVIQLNDFASCSLNPSSPTLLSDSADGVARKIYPAINRAWVTV